MRPYYELSVQVQSGSPQFRAYVFAQTLEEAKDVFDESFGCLKDCGVTADIKLFDQDRDNAVVARWTPAEGWMPVC